MAFTETQISDLITEGRQLATQFRELIDNARSFDNRYVAGGYSLVDGDFIGENAGIPAADFTTWISSIEAILTAWDAGQDTNAEKVAI